jgi:hypothetical protein
MTMFFSGMCLLAGWLAPRVMSRARRRRAIMRRERN